MTEQGNSSVYVGDFPSAITTGGTYEYFIHRRLGGSSVEGDPVVNTGKIDWTGSASVFVSSGALTGSEWLSYIVNTLGFKRTDKDDVVFAATTDAIQIMRRKFSFDEAQVDMTTTDTISTLGDFKIAIESNLGLLQSVILQDDDTGTPLDQVSKSKFDLLYPSINVDSDKGYPQHFCVYAGSIYIGPIPDQTSYAYRINYSTRAGIIVSSTTGVPFTNLYRDVLGDLTMSRIYLSLEDFEKSSFWEGRFNNSFDGALTRERLNSGRSIFMVRPFTV
jgi:hypothetical protein